MSVRVAGGSGEGWGLGECPSSDLQHPCNYLQYFSMPVGQGTKIYL